MAFISRGQHPRLCLLPQFRAVLSPLKTQQVLNNVGFGGWARADTLKVFFQSQQPFPTSHIVQFCFLRQQAYSFFSCFFWVHCKPKIQGTALWHKNMESLSVHLCSLFTYICRIRNVRRHRVGLSVAPRELCGPVSFGAPRLCTHSQASWTRKSLCAFNHRVTSRSENPLFCLHRF